MYCIFTWVSNHYSVIVINEIIKNVWNFNENSGLINEKSYIYFEHELNR